MLLSVVSDDDEAGAYRTLAAKASVDGVIVHGPRPDDPRIKLLKELELPFVVHGRADENKADYNWVDVNNRRSFQRATEFLLDLGHRRIALINGLETMDFASRRRDGYLTALLARGIKPDADMMVSEEMTEDFGFRSAINMLGYDTKPPTAFLVSSMITAIGVRRAIADMGRVMGRDVSVVIHDDELSYLRNGTDIPIFTAARSSVRQAGRICAETLLNIVNHPQDDAQHILMETELTVGESTGPLQISV